jgi:hypothetical protein
MGLFGPSKLVREGAQGEAVITAVTQAIGHAKVDLRVVYPDGSAVDIRGRQLSASVLYLPSVGDVLPVRYDVSDQRKVEIDVPALEARKAAADEARAVQASQRAASAEQALRQGVPPAMRQDAGQQSDEDFDAWMAALNSGDPEHAQRILANSAPGEMATATVTAAEGDPHSGVLRLSLQVVPPWGGSPYAASAEVVWPRAIAVPTVGSPLQVRVDRAAPGQVSPQIPA